MQSIFVVLAIALAASAAEPLPKFKVIRQWKYLNFTWPDIDSYKQADDNGGYIPQNIVMAGLKHHQDFYYVTLPRMKDGVPATLVRIPAGQTEETAPLLEPYPTWRMNKEGDCNSLQSVQNVEIDPKGRIWIIDGGRVQTFNRSPIVKCTPKLVVVDIADNRLVVSYNFPEEVASMNGSFLYDLVLDLEDGGYAYITDNGGKDPGIIVYSLTKNRSWKVRHSPSMRADPNLPGFTVNNYTLNAKINVAGIALTPRVEKRPDNVTVHLNEQREVYYSPLTSLHLYSLSTKVLKNESSANQGNEYQGSVMDYGLKPSPSVGMIMDNSGTMFYGLLTSSTIVKWDTRTPFTSNQKSIARDTRFLDWANSFTIEESGNLTVLVNRLEKFISSGLDIDQPNFMLVSAFIGTKNYMSEDGMAYQVPTTTSSTTKMQMTTTMESDKEKAMGMSGGFYNSPILSLVTGSLLFLIVRY